MLFNKINCKNCNVSHDECLEECPKCHTPSEHFLALGLNDKMTWTSLIRQIGLFLFGWLGLQFISTIYLLIVYFTAFLNSGGDLEIANSVMNNSLNLLLASTISYTFLLVGMVVIIWPQRKSVLKSYKSRKNVFYGAILGLALIGASVTYGIIISSFYTTSGNVNQSTLVELISKYPVVTVLIFGIVGPIVEEFAYRVGLFNFLSRSKRWVAYLITTLFFAFIHFNFASILNVIGNNTPQNIDVLINEFINLPQYLIAGLILCYTYEKYGFAGSTMAHVLNNLITIVSVLITIYK